MYQVCTVFLLNKDLLKAKLNDSLKLIEITICMYTERLLSTYEGILLT